MINDSIYEELCDSYDEQTISARTSHLYNRMNVFINKIGAENFALVNENILCHLVLDYFADIARLKKFHNIEFTNKEKIIAYTSYWLCRRKPIQLKLKRIDDKFAFINETFVTTFIFDEITELTQVHNLSEEIISHLFYQLKYRNYDAQNLELMIKSYISGFCDK